MEWVAEGSQKRVSSAPASLFLIDIPYSDWLFCEKAYRKWRKEEGGEAALKISRLLPPLGAVRTPSGREFPARFALRNGRINGRRKRRADNGQKIDKRLSRRYIESTNNSALLCKFAVAPRAGAWIEMRDTVSQGTKMFSRTPRGCTGYSSPFCGVEILCPYHSCAQCRAKRRGKWWPRICKNFLLQAHRWPMATGRKTTDRPMGK